MVGVNDTRTVRSAEYPLARLLANLGLALLCAGPASGLASEWQSLREIESAVESFVQAQAATLPGKRTVSVSRIDDRLKLTRCAQIEPYLPAGNRLSGNSSIGVRCTAPAAWSIYVPVQIRVSDNVLVTVRPIASGQAVAAGDVQLQWRDITPFAGSALTAPEQAVGRILSAPVAAGVPLRAGMLRDAKVIRYGQPVQLVARGQGFSITSEATAMGNAGNGETVAVKTRSGQIIKGTARADGTVEVGF